MNIRLDSQDKYSFNPIVGHFPKKMIKVANEFVYEHKLTVRLLNLSFKQYYEDLPLYALASMNIAYSVKLSPFEHHNNF